MRANMGHWPVMPTVYKDVIELDHKIASFRLYPVTGKARAGETLLAVLADELHSWVMESQRRLWDEMIIPPTQVEGVRWIASYAGFLGEGELLKEILGLQTCRAKKSANPCRFIITITPCFWPSLTRGEVSWRMPWITPEYISQIRESERENTFQAIISK